MLDIRGFFGSVDEAKLAAESMIQRFIGLDYYDTLKETAFFRVFDLIEYKYVSFVFDMKEGRSEDELFVGDGNFYNGTMMIDQVNGKKLRALFGKLFIAEATNESLTTKTKTQGRL